MVSDYQTVELSYRSVVTCSPSVMSNTPPSSSPVGNTTVHTGSDSAWLTMQSMMMSLMESAKADREEAKREREATAKNTARLESQVQQLQQLLSTGHSGLATARTSRLAADPLLTPPPSALPFGTGLMSAAASNLPSSRVSARRNLGGQLAAVAGSTEEQPIVAAVSSPSGGDEEDEDDAPRDWAKALENMTKSGRAPEKFSGDDAKQRVGARTWLLEVENWIDGFLGDEGFERERARQLGRMLTGSAMIWWKALKVEAKLRGTPLTWDVVERLFLAKYEGVDNRLLYEQELDTLQLGRGRCGDINKLDAEIDRLRMIVYPESEVDEIADRLVASKYGAAISRGDRDMFSDILKMGERAPQTLSEWKMRAARVISARTMQQRLPQNRSQMYRPAVSSSSSKGTTAGVSVSNAQSSGQEAGDHGEENGEDEPEAGAAAQSMSAGSKPPGRNRSVANKPRQSGGRHTLSDEEFNHRRLNRLCWSCGAPDHRVDGCPSRQANKIAKQGAGNA